MSRPASATTKAAKRAARRPAHAQAAAAFIGPRPFLPSAVPTRSRRGTAALEREADRTADAVLAGAVGLARTLSPTRPATRHVPGSAGHPLASDIRERLERGLGADLSRIRVHDDAAAHLVAELEGVGAFAAGPDIYLGSHGPGPGTEAGLHLMAHEVVHVLQQTGRESTDGRRKATDARGSGEIQADAFLDRFIASTPHEVFTTVVQDHGGPDAGSPIERYVRVVAARLSSAVDQVTPAFQDLASDVEVGVHGAETAAEQSFLLDLMKAGREWEAAAALIETAAEPLATQSTSSEFLQWLLRDHGRPVSWASEIVEQVAALKTFRDHVYGAFRIFLVRPDRPGYAVEGRLAAEMYRAPAWVSTRLGIDERTWLAALFLSELETNRVKIEAAADARSGSTLVTGEERARDFSRNAVFRGWRRAGELAPRLAKWGVAVDATKEPIQRAGVAWFEERRRLALTFWQSALELWNNQLRNRLTTGRTDLPEDRRTELRQALKANPVAASAARLVSAAGVVYLAPTQAELPDAAAYAARVATFVGVLAKQSKTVLSDLSDFRFAEATRARAELVPWLVLRLEWLRQQALTYVAKDDVSSFDDSRHGHRLLMSTELRRLAYELDDSALEEAAVAVQHNEAGTGSRLVLISEWQRPASSDLTKLSQDFAHGVKFSDQIVLDPYAIAAFYREAHLRRLGDSIERQLDPATQSPDPNRLVLKRAIDDANAVPSAARWTVAKMAWAPREGETRSIAEIIRTHPRSLDKLPAETALSVMVYPGQEQEGSLAATPQLSGVFAWELPAWDQLAAQMAAALAGLPETAGLGPVGTDPIGWMKRLDALMVEQKGPSKEQVTGEVRRSLYERAQVQRARLGTGVYPPGLLREATNHDRLVVARRATELLNAYDARIGTWQQPLDALGLVEQFHRYAMPPADNLAQTVALIVEIASALRAAFVREGLFGVVLEEERYDIVTGYYGFLVITQQWLEDPQRRLQLTGGFLRLTDAQLATATADLAAVRETFETVQRRIQRGRGFESRAGDKLRSLNYPFDITPQHQFGIGDSFELMRVLKLFRFHPKYGESGEAVAGVDRQQRLAEVIDPTTKKLLPPDTELLEIRINDRPTIITASDLELLDTIWRAVEEKAFQLSMDNLLQAMSDVATLAVDLVELVPGAGQAVMIGRIVYSVGTFLASADFEDIRAIVTGELVEQVNGLIANLETMLDPDEIWMFLLFGSDNVLLRKLSDAGGTAKKPRAVTRKPGRLGRLLRLLLSLGSLVARQVELMRDRVQPPLRSAQSFVVTHPIVASVVNLAAEAIAMGPAVADGIGWLGEFTQDPAQAFSDRIEALVSVIDHFELPKEIIPNAVLVGAILGLILDRFGAKGKILRRALEITGAMAEISEMVADALPEIADPNRLWVETLRPLVDSVLTDLRKELVDGIYGALGLIGLTKVARPVDRKVEAKLVAGPDHEEDDAAPALAPGKASAIGTSMRLDHLVPASGGDVVPPGPGAPLPAGTRAGAETDFGRSFEHVRLHRSTLGEGVDALSRGSHVVIRHGLSLDDGDGARVLRHELSHVSEHTADEPRPRPTRGRPGTAVRFDPAAEARADRAAHGSAIETAAGSGRSTSMDAAATALTDEMLGKVLTRLASYEDLNEYQKDIHKPVSTLPPMTPEQKQVMADLKQSLIQALRAPALPISGVPRGTGAYTDTHALVRKHAGTTADWMRDLDRDNPEVLDRIGRRALKEDTSGPKPKNDEVQERKLVLVPSQLSSLLEGYLLIKRGLLVKLDLPHDVTLLESQLRARNLDLKVTGIFLGATVKTSPLWEPILKGQLRLHTTLEGRPVPEESKAEGVTRVRYEISDEAAQAAIFQAVVLRIRAIGPLAGAGLKPLVYELSDDVLEHAVDTLAVGLELKPDELPSPSSYVRTKLGLGGGEFGLRVGTHGSLGPFTSKSRHSHHTTQFLFAEYFVHESGRKPFARDEPGLKWAGTRPSMLYRADSPKPIELGRLYGTDGARGDPMPAILLAHTTHQSAGLHVPPSRPTGNDPQRSSQSNTVDGWFRAKAPVQKPEEAAPGTDAASLSALTDVQKARNRALVEGVENVYREMRLRMMRALKSGLVSEEKPYYETVAARRANALDDQGALKAELQLDTADLRRVFKAAEENNYEVMKSYGVTAAGGSS